MKIANYEEVVKVVLSTNKVVSRFGVKDFDGGLSRYLKTIDVINNLPYYSRVIGEGRFDIEEYQISKVLSFLIAPASITVRNPEQDLDLLVKEEVSQEEVMTPVEFNLFTDAINGAFKLGKDALTPIVRTNGLLADYLDHTIIDGHVIPSLEPFLPVELSVDVSLSIRHTSELEAQFASMLRTAVHRAMSK